MTDRKYRRSTRSSFPFYAAFLRPPNFLEPVRSRVLNTVGRWQTPDVCKEELRTTAFCPHTHVLHRRGPGRISDPRTSFHVSATHAMDWSELKTTADVGFCRRQRQYRACEDDEYKVHSGSVQISQWRGIPAVTALLETRYGNRPSLLLAIVVLEGGIFRIAIEDAIPLEHARHSVTDIVIEGTEVISLDDGMVVLKEDMADIHFDASKPHIQLVFDPFSVHLVDGSHDNPLVSFNGDARLKLDDRVNEPREGWKGESFRGFYDPQVRGPESIGADISFPSATDVYGIPERTSAFSLPVTISSDGGVISEPYRLYNLDVSYYEMDKPLGLYGCVPLMYARSGSEAVGMFWHNSSETYVDLTADSKGNPNRTHWFSESGIMDMFILPGPSVRDVYRQYLCLTGKPCMPQRFALGYHQCRYSYMSEDDATNADKGFDEHDIPYDVLWLDIDHTSGKRYFTWDYKAFPRPEALQKTLFDKGRRLVTIVDPHIFRDGEYDLNVTAVEKRLYVRGADGSDFVGDCWPGQSSYVDYTSGRVREEWANRFSAEHYPHFAKGQFIWNDMNEPSVFDGPERTMPKDLLHGDGNVEHRHVHNAYGHHMVQATHAGLIKGHGGNERPFILTRSFFGGSHRYSAVWTGDNAASWDHLRGSVRMLLPLQLCGIALSGADVGGFFGNPSAELATRWYQAGAFQPFFRGHSNKGTDRREPWVFGEPWTQRIRTAIRMRYQYVGHWYTLFAACAMGTEKGFADAGPPMRPLWWEFGDSIPSDWNEQAWMVGRGLLVAPVMEEGARLHEVYLPAGERWYDLFNPMLSGRELKVSGKVEMEVDIERMVVLQRGGSVVCVNSSIGGCTQNMSFSRGLTVMVALDNDGRGEGDVYIDDGRSFDFESGAYILNKFIFEDDVLRVEWISGNGFDEEMAVERVVVMGVKGKVREVEVKGKGAAWDQRGGVVTLDIDVRVVEMVDANWTVRLVQ